jgi:hypothetical protein
MIKKEDCCKCAKPEMKNKVDCKICGRPVITTDNYFVRADKFLGHDAVRRVVEHNCGLVTPILSGETKEQRKERTDKTILEVYGSFEAYNAHCEAARRRKEGVCRD